MTDELTPMPCPFCGSRNLYLHFDCVRCNNCTAEGPMQPGATASEAIEEWNRRAQPESAALAEKKGADGLPVSAPRLYADEEPLDSAPSVEPMTVLDIADDDALRFVQRVLESNAPESDRDAARQMVADIRTRVRRTASAAPSVVEPEPVAYMCIMPTPHGEPYKCITSSKDGFPVWRHPPRAPLTVDEAIHALASALRDSKGWLRDYSDAVIRDAIDRKEPRAPLTDAEIAQFADEWLGSKLVDSIAPNRLHGFARAIESRLGAVRAG